jgi:Flp pilus assembly protein TadD
MLAQSILAKSMLRTLLVLWFATQALSPEADQHMQAGIAADKQRQFDVAITEFRKVTELEPTFAEGFISLGQA